MSKVKELELENAILKARLQRIRDKISDIENGCHMVGEDLYKRGDTVNEKIGDLFWAIADDLYAIDSEHDRYFVEP